MAEDNMSHHPCNAIGTGDDIWHEADCPGIWHTATREPMRVPCSHCGAEFVPNTPTQRTCCDECDAAYYG
jgi:hypothetical protein